VTAVDLAIPEGLEGITFIHADLERGEFKIEPNAWDLIVCWLYWQENLLPSIAAGIRPGGIAALAGKRTGRFATSLAKYRAAFPGWEEILAGEDDYKAFLITRQPRRQARSELPVHPGIPPSRGLARISVRKLQRGRLSIRRHSRYPPGRAIERPLLQS
jgi:hypothetical protein